MVADAEKFASEDAAKREQVEVRNSADSMVYQTEKQVQELDEKIPQDVKEKVLEKVAELKQAIASDDLEKMKTAQEDLQQQVMAMGQAMYQGTGSETGQEASTDPSQDDVIDAEFSSDK
jgi:molecular chaperone DnaK (HSP70)